MRSRKELTARQARRYRRASRALKGNTLDKFVAATGYSRDYAAKLLSDYGRERLQSTGSGKSVRLVAAKGRRSAGGRPVVYRPPVCRAGEIDCSCSGR